MKLVNLSAHPCNIVDATGEIALSIPASGTIARAATSEEIIGEIAGIPVSRWTFGAISGLPAPEEGVVYIVSMLVASHPLVRDRLDVVSPNSSRFVKDAEGKVIGVPGFCRY